MSFRNVSNVTILMPSIRRHLTLVCLSIALSSRGFAQDQFIEIDDYPNGSIIHCVESNGVCFYYVSTTVNLVYSESNRFHSCVLIDEQCDLKEVSVQELRDEATDGNDYEPDMFFGSGGFFIEYMNYRDWKNDIIVGLFHIYDSNLEYLKTDSINASVIGWYPIKRDGKYQYVGLRILPAPLSTLIATFSTSDTSVSTAEVHTGLSFISSMIFEDSLEQYIIYHVSGLGKMDTLFNVLQNVHSTFVHTGVLGDLEFLDSKVISFGARLPPMISLWQVTFNSYDRNLLLLNDETYGDTLEDDYPFIKNCLELTDEAIFTGAVLDIVEPFETFSKPIEFVITKYDRSRNQIWRHNYGGDAAYNMFGLKATPDGGCVAYGNRRNDVDGLRYPFMLKIDKDGLTTSVNETPGSHAFTLYGNPVSQNMMIYAEFSFSDKYAVMLTDVSGHIVLHEELMQGLNVLNVVHLPTGIYFYSILNETTHRVVESTGVSIVR